MNTETSADCFEIEDLGSGCKIKKYIGTQEKVVIPAKISGSPVVEIVDGAIGYGAFYCSLDLVDITVPNGVTKIGSHAFDGCQNLTNISLPASVTEIGAYAFANCENLKYIDLPENLKEIGEAAFYGCDSLILCGPGGSCAQKYAKKNGVPFTVNREDQKYMRANYPKFLP